MKFHPEIRSMVQKSGEHQLRLVVYPMIYRVLYIPGGCLGFLNHQQYVSKKKKEQKADAPSIRYLRFE